jgi:hypothetical protein
MALSVRIARDIIAQGNNVTGLLHKWQETQVLKIDKVI